jgi:hypothetical protein
MGLYYKNHRISGVNFLPRLTLSEYNNLTVKPEHWIRTDSPFDYSKTDVPKLTLAQYQDLAIKPKFWIRTDAPQSYTNISATQVDVTDSVSVKDYLDDLNATQVSYSNGVSVKDKIDELDYSSDTSSSNMFILKKQGKVANCFLVWGNIQFQSDGFTLTATLPNGYKPSVDVSIVTKVYNGSAYVDCVFSINTYGQIRLY